MEREPVERELDARDPDARDPDPRDAVERLAVLRAVPEAERAVERVERVAEAPAFVSAWRSLSKSLRACLLVFAASRRSARSYEVTSL